MLSGLRMRHRTRVKGKPPEATVLLFIGSRQGGPAGTSPWIRRLPELLDGWGGGGKNEEVGDGETSLLVLSTRRDEEWMKCLGASGWLPGGWVVGA
jgi:hypothetical protein